MIGNVVFSDVDNVVTCIYHFIDLLAIVFIITVEAQASIYTSEVSRSHKISKKTSYLPSNLGICIHGVHILPVFLRYWDYYLSNP